MSSSRSLEDASSAPSRPSTADAVALTLVLALFALSLYLEIGIPPATGN